MRSLPSGLHWDCIHGYLLGTTRESPPTCCVISVKLTSFVVLEKLWRRLISSGLRRVMVDRVMFVFSKFFSISSLYCGRERR